MRGLLLFISAALLLFAQPSRLRDDAMRLFREQKFREAIRPLEQLLKVQPADRNARYLLALCWQQLEEAGKAETEFLHLIEREPKWAQAHYAYARLLFLRGRFDDALRLDLRAEQLGEPKARTRHLAGRIEEERGRYAAALQAYRESIAADRNQAESLSGEASVLFKLGRYAEAKSSAAAALQVDPAWEEARRIADQIARLPAANAPQPNTKAAEITFERKTIPFRLENNATSDKHLVSTMAGGLAIFDYDNDGRPDLFFTNGSALPSLRKSEPRFANALYRNLGNWQFEDVTERSGLRGEGFSMGAAAADFDNDGWIDLFVAGAGHNQLYRNLRGRFEAVPGIVSEKWSVTGAWLDYDSDGLLDLFVVNYLDWTPQLDRFCGQRERNLRVYCHPSEYRGTTNRLYRNLGDGRFQDVSKPSGIARHVGRGMSAAVADFDDDGRPDVFVTNDTVANFLFRNTGAGFEEIALQAGVAYNDMGKPLSSMGVDFRDYNNDGRPDILFTALVGETFPLFLNLGNGSFRDMTYPSKAGLTTVRRSGWGVAFADLNNDGFKDIVTANSHVTDNIEAIRSERYREPNLILRNENGYFQFGGDFGAPAAHRGLAVADLDGDGRLDVVVTVLGEQAELWRNTTAGAGNWIAVRLKGQAIGARVRAGNQWQEMGSAGSYASSVAFDAHFGIGAAKTVEVEVRWPHGHRQVIPNAKAGEVLMVEEPRRPLRDR